MIIAPVKKAPLRIGSRGSSVKELQQLLNAYQNHLTVDGDFGPVTEDAVKDFQFVRFLNNDGVVGPTTWRAIFTGAPVDMPTLRLNVNRDEVKNVQNILSRLLQNDNTVAVYYPGLADGRFGIFTERAVKAFQSSSGLEVDGIVGHRTWHALSKHGYLLYSVRLIAA